MDVTIQNPPADCTAITLHATVESDTGTQALDPPQLAGQPTLIRFWLPSGAHGPLVVEAHATRASGCPETQGRATVPEVAGQSALQVTLMLSDYTSCPGPTDPCSQTWCPVVPDGVNSDLQAVFGTDANHVWAAGSLGTILFWNGSAWSAESVSPPLPSTTFRAIGGESLQDLWAVGDNGAAAQRSATGSSWTMPGGTVPSTPALGAVFGLNGAPIVGGVGGTWNFSGTTWTSDYSTSYRVFGLYATAAKDIWAIVGGASSSAMHFTGSPAAWNAESIPDAAFDLYGVAGTGQDNVWVMGDHVFYQWTGSFTKIPWQNDNITINKIWMGSVQGATRLFGAGPNSGSQGQIVDFTPLSMNPPGPPMVTTLGSVPFQDVWFAENGEGWAVGARTVIYHYKP